MASVASVIVDIITNGIYCVLLQKIHVTEKNPIDYSLFIFFSEIFHIIFTILFSMRLK